MAGSNRIVQLFKGNLLIFAGITVAALILNNAPGSLDLVTTDQVIRGWLVAIALLGAGDVLMMLSWVLDEV